MSRLSLCSGIKLLAILLFAPAWMGATPSSVGASIPEAQIREKVTGKITQIYRGEKARFEIEWITRMSQWNIGQPIDSIAVRYPAGRRPRGQTVLRVEACHRGRVVRRLSYTVRVRVFRPVAVCRRKIDPGQPLDSADFAWREMEITQLPGEPVPAAAQLEGMQTRRQLRPGTILTADALTPVPLIRRGETATLRYESAHVRIEMQAEALQNGAAGEMIWFFFPENRKRYKARVVNEDLAIVQQ